MSQAALGETEKANMGLTSGAPLSSVSLPPSFPSSANYPLLSLPELMLENTLPPIMVICDVLPLPVIDNECSHVTLADAL